MSWNNTTTVDDNMCTENSILPYPPWMSRKCLFNYLSFCSTFCIYDTATKQNNFDVYSQQSINNHLFILYKFVLNKHDQMIFQNPNMTSLHVLDNESFKIQLPWQNVVIKMSLFLKIPYNTIRLYSSWLSIIVRAIARGGLWYPPPIHKNRGKGEKEGEGKKKERRKKEGRKRRRRKKGRKRKKGNCDLEL